MPIDVACGACGQKMRVADTYADKRVKCPKCQAVVQIPSLPAADTDTAANTWHMRTPDGQIFGPVARPELEQWVAQHRVTTECQLLRDDWQQWRWADEIFPQIVAQQRAAAAAVPQRPSPFARGADLRDPSRSGAPDRPAATSQSICTPRTITAFHGTRLWVLWASILGFISTGLNLISVLLELQKPIQRQTVMVSGPALVSFLVTTGISVAAAYFLWQYAAHLAAHQESRSPKSLLEAFKAQKSYWRLWGITMAVVIVLAVGAMLSALVIGMAGR